MAAPEESQDSWCMEAILSGIAPNVTKDLLINFLECKAPDFHVDDVEFKKEGSAAIITYENPVDLEMLQRVCEKEPLKGRVLKVLPVDKRGAVLIHSPSPNTSTSSFRFYLSNKRRTGASSVVDIHRDESDLFLIAYYPSREDAEQVAKREHILENQKLKLVFFDPNFDELPDSNEDHSFASPAESESVVFGQSQTSSQQSCVSAESDHDFLQDAGAVGSGPDRMTPDLQDAAVLEKKPELCVREVKGLTISYQNVLDVFSDSISEQLPGIQVKIEDGSVKIEGEQHEVKKVEMLVDHLCETQMSSTYVNEIAGCFNGWDSVLKEIEESVDRGQYRLCIREGLFGREEFGIGMIHYNQLLSFDDFLQRFVSSKPVPLKSKQAEELLETTAWDEFRESDLEDKFGDKITAVHNTEYHQIDVIGNVADLDEAVKSVELFLMNSHVEEKFVLSSVEKAFMEIFWPKSKQGGTGIDFAEVSIDGLHCTIKGNRAGVRREESRFDTFRKKLKCKRAILTHPDIAKLQHHFGDLWKDLVRRISEENQCLIQELPDPRISDADDDHEDWGQWVATVIHSCSLPNQKLEVHLVDGKAEDLKVDAVVMCCRDISPPEPSAPHAQGARPKLYPSLQEHRSLPQQREGILVTQPGARPCKAVIQVSMPYYFPAGGESPWEASVERLISNLVNECERHGIGSLALPVLGVDVGDLKPIDVAAKTLAACITRQCCQDSWSGKFEASSLQHVCLCSTRPACLHALTDVLQADLPWIVSPPTPHSLSFLATDLPRARPGDPNSGLIEIIKGDISKAQVECLVVPCDIDIDLDLYKSQITKSLLRGGSTVQTTLQRGDTYFSHDSIENRNEVLAEQRILTGKGGTLYASHIFYLFLPPWGPSARQVLIECVQKSLKEAAIRKLRAVALTALGVGKLEYPARCAARTALCAVADFMERKPTSVRNVKFVIYDHDTFAVYKEEYWEWARQQPLSSGGGSLPPLVYPHHTDPSYAQALSHSGHSPHGSSTDGPMHGGRNRGQAASRGARQARKGSVSIQVNFIKLQVKMGDIVYDKSDAVVNSINSDFDFNRGAVSQAFRDQCGDFLVRLCKEKHRMKAMKSDGVVVTSAPGLMNHQSIVHLDLSRYRQKPKDTLLKCLTKLLKERSNCKSVAFPVLGANRPGEAEQVLTHMKEALRELKKTKKLEEVWLVAASPQIFQHLASCLTPATSRQYSPLPPNPSSRQSNTPTTSNKGGAAVYPPSLPTSSRVLLTKAPRSKWADKNALSLFIFSDKEESRQQACVRLAEELESCLGPVRSEADRSHDTNPARRTQDYDDFQPGCFHTTYGH
ncbi:uncharacterized protein LOC143297864 [Babylonia areolata]|uniref:uncharacterized protein LOC143297864 n=1 Tax=Babylonia areolata TaxID=304850 RepID=UPI003FD25873